MAIEFLVLTILILVSYGMTGLFMAVVRAEDPSAYKAINTGNDTPSGIFDSILGSFGFGLVYILPLDYEKWSISSKAKWIGRMLWILTVLYLVYIAYFLMSLILLI